MPTKYQFSKIKKSIYCHRVQCEEKEKRSSIRTLHIKYVVSLVVVIVDIQEVIK